MYLTNCSIEKSVKLKWKLRSPGTGSAAIRPPRLLCYRLAVFSCPLWLISLSFPKKNSALILKCYFTLFSFLTLRKSAFAQLEICVREGGGGGGGVVVSVQRMSIYYPATFTWMLAFISNNCIFKMQCATE